MLSNVLRRHALIWQQPTPFKIFYAEQFRVTLKHRQSPDRATTKTRHDSEFAVAQKLALQWMIFSKKLIKAMKSAFLLTGQRCDFIYRSLKPANGKNPRDMRARA